jgi:BolA protein
MNVTQEIKTILETEFEPVELTILDDSKNHEEHLDSRETVTHIRITIASRKFNNMTLLQQHKNVMVALKEYTKRIHAISIKTKTVQ